MSRSKLKVLKESQVYKDWIKDEDKVVIIVPASDYPDYLSEMVIVKNRPNSYSLYRFFGVTEGNLSVSGDVIGESLDSCLQWAKGYSEGNR